MTRYRVCFNDGPFAEPYWTVERETPHWVFWSLWVTVRRFSPQIMALAPRTFETEAAAQAWIEEAKRPTIHRCGPAQ